MFDEDNAWNVDDTQEDLHTKLFGASLDNTPSKTKELKNQEAPSCTTNSEVASQKDSRLIEQNSQKKKKKKRKADESSKNGTVDTSLLVPVVTNNTVQDMSSIKKKKVTNLDRYEDSINTAQENSSAISNCIEVATEEPIKEQVDKNKNNESSNVPVKKKKKKKRKKSMDTTDQEVDNSANTESIFAVDTVQDTPPSNDTKIMNTVLEENLSKPTKKKKKKKNKLKPGVELKADFAGEKNLDSDAISVDFENSILKIESTPPITGLLTKKQNKFQAKLEKKMAGGQFRWLNERLYSQPSSESFSMFSEDMSLFQAYHTGFQEQVRGWPSNPVDIYISELKQSDASLVVADIGCGEAKIAQNVPQKVHSFDLKAINNHVTVADMAKLPLKKCSADIAIFCLSLMGTNINDFIVEARRILKPDGQLKIAEVKSRINDVDKFAAQVAELGYEFLHLDDSNKMFVLFEFTKLQGDIGDAKQIHLKPCIYKRR